MTDQIKKENISTRTIEILANYQGYEVESVKRDYGVDIRIIENTYRELEDGRKQIFPTNRELKAQLKATTEKGIKRRNGNIIYDLRAKNFNDLVQHQHWKRPTYLMLIILPDDEEMWLSYSKSDLVLRSECYWYIHPENTEMTTNRSKKMIRIPENQIISLDTFSTLLNHIYN